MQDISLMKSKLGAKFSLRKHARAYVLSLVIGFIAAQIPFAAILGSSQSFTLFDFVAPIMGALWGLPVGIASVFSVNFINMFLHGNFELGAWIRLLPALFAVWYFARRKATSPVVALVCMALFVIHPVGRAAWIYSLYWLIPLMTTLVSRNNVFTSALGATFTQHAVGGVAFLYAYSFTPAFWNGLVPVVAGERMMIALGIALSYSLVQLVLRQQRLTAVELGLSVSKSPFAVQAKKS